MIPPTPTHQIVLRITTHISQYTAQRNNMVLLTTTHSRQPYILLWEGHYQILSNLIRSSLGSVLMLFL